MTSRNKTVEALTIGRAAALAGVGVETIRFYERRELIEQPPKPEGTGYRAYPHETVQRIRFIRQAQEIGFSLREIDDLLSLRADPAADSAAVRDRAIAKRAEVEQKIANLQRIHAALEQLIAACPGRGALRQCSIMESLIAGFDDGPATEPTEETV
jgi:MerR family transcriptional regulator, copper efflux regulator